MVPTCFGLWAVGAVAAPVLAPLFDVSKAVASHWRWIFWLLMWICALAFVILSFFLPETLASYILHRRSKRLRQLTGDFRYHTNEQSERQTTQISALVIETVWRPFALIISEPGVLAFYLYIALVYGSYYLFFEAYPLVFNNFYHFSVVEQGLLFRVLVWGVPSHLWSTSVIYESYCTTSSKNRNVQS
jgi:DHA1 family multidrug resistance protein-like MFS transporter